MAWNKRNWERSLKNGLHYRIAISLQKRTKELTLRVMKRYGCSLSQARRLLSGAIHGCHGESALWDSMEWMVNGPSTPRTRNVEEFERRLERAADSIAAELFRGGSDGVAARLALAYRDGPGASERLSGGWCQDVVRDVILRHLQEYEKAKTESSRYTPSCSP